MLPVAPTCWRLPPRLRPLAPAKRVGAFAIVASEVKELARQTADSSEEVRRQIAAVQEVAVGASTAVNAFAATIREIDEIAGGINAMVEEQTHPTGELARSVSQTADRERDVAGTDHSRFRKKQ